MYVYTVCVCIYILYVYMYVCMYVCMHILYVCMYVCMYYLSFSFPSLLSPFYPPSSLYTSHTPQLESCVCYHYLNTHEKWVSFVDVCIAFNFFVHFFLQKFAMLSHHYKQWRYCDCNARGGKEGGNGGWWEWKRGVIGFQTCLKVSLYISFQILWVWHNWSTKSKVQDKIIVL